MTGLLGLTTIDQYYIAEILPISSSPNAINDTQCFDLSRSSTRFVCLYIASQSKALNAQCNHGLQQIHITAGKTTCFGLRESEKSS